MNELQQKVFDYLTQPGHPQRLQAMQDLMERHQGRIPFFRSGLGSESATSKLEAYLKDNPRGFCDDGIRRFRQAVGLPLPLQEWEERDLRQFHAAKVELEMALSSLRTVSDLIGKSTATRHTGPGWERLSPSAAVNRMDGGKAIITELEELQQGIIIRIKELEAKLPQPPQLKRKGRRPVFDDEDDD